MGTNCDSRPLCQESTPRWINDGTQCRAESPIAGPLGERKIPPHAVQYLSDEEVSIELADAPRQCMPTSLTVVSLAQMRVLSWLQAHKQAIVAAEARFHVDRRAIAGAIAWEALLNIRGGFAGTFGRFVGPAKSHVISSVLSRNKDTLVKQVEDAAWLPRSEQIPTQTYDNRVKLLETADGAITYIAAAMNAAAHMAKDKGFPGIRSRPEVLTFFWQKKDLKTWGELLTRKPKTEDFKTGPDPKKDMDRWVADNLDYLADGVGEPDVFLPLWDAPSAPK